MDLIHAVHARPKTRWHPSAVDATLHDCLALAGHVPRHTVPVFHAGEVVGIVRGIRPGRVRWRALTSHEFSGFDSYNALNNAMKNGQALDVPFQYASSGIAKQWADFWAVGNYPVAGAYSGTAATLKQFDNTSQGGLFSGQPYCSPGASQDYFMAAWEISCSTRSATLFILYDRVAAYDGCSITTTTTTLDNTLPALRYTSAGNEGLCICPVASATTGATASNLSACHYTDQDGNASQAIAAGWTMPWQANSSTSVVAVPYDNTNAQISTPFLPLLGGDSGARLVKDFTSSAINTGTISWGLFKPVGYGAINPGIAGSGGVVQRRDLARATFALEKIFSTACLSVLQYGNASQALMGKLQLAWG